MRKGFFITAALIAVTWTGLAAQDLKGVVPQLSPMATDTYTRILQAAADIGGRKIDIQVVPFARAVYLVETKAADIESSLIQNPDKSKWAALKYDFSTVEIVKIVFVLYSNKSKAISVADLKAGNAKGLKFETDATQVDYFPFAISPSTSIDASLKKVDAGTIDGYLFSQGSGDPALKRLALKNITRQYYDTFSGSFLLQKGGRGGPLDAMLSDAIDKLKASGKFQEIVGPYAATASKYVDWQP
jgi:polar amino acid transport system substrate-binding protein